jgi:hypothetical protein
MGLATHDAVQIRLRGRPVLCVDTCSVLDVMRDATRGDSDLNSLQAAVDLIGKAESGHLVVLFAEQVKHELSQHLSRIEQEAAAGIQKHLARVKLVDDVARLFGSASTIGTAHLVGHELRARAVVDRLIAQELVVAGDDQIAGRAVVRVNFGRTPGGTGKQSIKDCVVVETYLEAARTLRAATFPERIVFLSSNTQDYCQPATRHLPADLASEFAPLAIDYAPNWAAARHCLGL